MLTLENSGTKCIMVVETSDYLHRLKAHQFNLFTQKLHNSISKSLKKFKGKIISYNDNSYVVSFNSVTNIILCALKIRSNFKYVTPKFDASIRKLQIGISDFNATKNAELLATRMCEVVKYQIVISSKIKSLYENENRNAFINKEHIRTLKPSEVAFLTNLMDFVETIWNNSSFKVEDFSKELGFSKSQLYRKLVNLTGKSANNFIREFRLHRALNLLHDRKGNISEIAYKTGFNSPAYFSKCFFNKYKILPSKYVQQYIS